MWPEILFLFCDKILMRIKPLGTCPNLPHKLASRKGVVMDNRKAKRYFQALRTWLNDALQRTALLKDVLMLQTSRERTIQSIIACLEKTHLHLDWLKLNGYPNEGIETLCRKLRENISQLIGEENSERK